MAPRGPFAVPLATIAKLPVVTGNSTGCGPKTSSGASADDMIWLDDLSCFSEEVGKVCTGGSYTNPNYRSATVVQLP